MSTRQLSLKEIHEYEFELLKKFVEVCEKNHLRYYLAGGTLLGAIRHKGFIPWDDDIDILMPRPDYDKFIKCSDEIEEIPYYKVASFEQGNLNYPFCKIFNINTKIDKFYIEDTTEQSLWIDILPLDGLPNDDRIVRQLFHKSLLARRCLRIQKAKIGRGNGILRTIFKPLFKLVLSLIGIKQTVAYIDKISRSYRVDDMDYIGGIAMGYGPEEKMPKEEYLKAVKVEFEGELFNAPGCWDYYLTALFGNYMELPPKDKQVAHPMTILVEVKNT